MLNVKSGLVLMSMLLVSAAGCGDDTATGGGGAGGGDEGGGGAAVDPFAQYYACEENEYVDAKPMSGAGLDEDGNLIGAPQTTYFMHTTQLYVPEDKSGPFLGLVGDVIGQLAETPGLIGYALGSDDSCLVNRTMGIWESEEAMYAFVASGAHATVMGQVGDVSITGKTTHWMATAEEVTALTTTWSVASWDEARTRLEDVEPLSTYE